MVRLVPYRLSVAHLARATPGRYSLSAADQGLQARRHRVTHRTEYRYSDVVTSSYGRGFLTPRDSQRQRCIAHRLTIDPVPSDSSTSVDGYGNISS